MKGGKVPRFTFIFDFDENYFQNYTVKGAFEYDTGKIIAILNEIVTIKFLDRSMRSEVKPIEMANITAEKKYCSLRPFPNFDIKTNPYVLVKDTKSLNVINVSTYQQRVIVKNSPYKWDVNRTCMMDLVPSIDGKTITVYNLEMDTKIVPGNNVSDHNSAIKKYTITL